MIDNDRQTNVLKLSVEELMKMHNEVAEIFIKKDMSPLETYGVLKTMCDYMEAKYGIDNQRVFISEEES